MWNVGSFVARSEEQERFLRVLGEVSASDGGPDEGHVVLVQGYGGMGKSMLLSRFADIAAGRVPGTSVGRFTVFGVDWERDRDHKHHAEDYVAYAGPPIWRILVRITAALDDAAAQWKRRDRRRLKGFGEFRLQIARIPALEGRAAKLGIEQQVAHQPVAAKVSELLKAGGVVAGTAAESAGVSGAQVAGRAAGTVAGAAVDVLKAMQENRSRIDPADYRSLVDEVEAVVTAFVTGMRKLARRRPVVVLLDTSELLGGSGPWLRDVMRRCGRRVVWVVGLRSEPESRAAEDSEAYRYRSELDERRLRAITLTRFDDRTAAAYLEQQLDELPAGLDIGRVIALTHGVPLALYIMAQLIQDQLQAGAPLDELYEDVAPNGQVSTVVLRMAIRYLRHAVHEGSELNEDLMALYGLALVHSEGDVGGSSLTSDGAALQRAREPRPVVVTADPGLLAALWGVPVEDIAVRIRELGRRHDFVHSGDGTLHRDVRDAIRGFLLNPAERVRVVNMNRRAVAYLTERLSELTNSGIEDRLADPTWRATSAALLWHTYWENPVRGVSLLRMIFPSAAVLQPAYARLLLDISGRFIPFCPAADQAVLTGLTHLTRVGDDTDGSELSDSACTAMTALAAAHGSEPHILDGDQTPYLHLVRAWAGPRLGLTLREQVAEFRRAATMVRPGSGATATRMGDIAYAITVPDITGETPHTQKRFIALKKLAIRYQPKNAHFRNDLGVVLFDLRQFSDAEAAYRKALEIDPSYAVAHNNLGTVLWERGSYDDAKAEFSSAIRLDPDFAMAHHSLGYALNAMGRYTEAVATCREAIRLEPDQVHSHSNLGYALSRLGRHDEAEAALHEAIRLDPDLAIAYANLGHTLTCLGRFTDAETAYRQAIELDPSYSRGYGYLARLRLFAGDYRKARTLLLRGSEVADGSEPMIKFLLWVTDRIEPPEHEPAHTSEAVLTALENPVRSDVRRFAFATAEIRALATAASGAPDRAEEILRIAAPNRAADDLYARPLYDLLAKPEPLGGLDQLHHVWRQIIATDPTAIGPWGGPPDY